MLGDNFTSDKTNLNLKYTYIIRVVSTFEILLSPILQYEMNTINSKIEVKKYTHTHTHM